MEMHYLKAFRLEKWTKWQNGEIQKYIRKLEIFILMQNVVSNFLEYFQARLKRYFDFFECRIRIPGS